MLDRLARPPIALLAGVALAITAVASPHRADAQQVPQKFENLKFFPMDIPRDSLLGIMRGFTQSLGVRCQYCHVTVAADANAGGGRGGGGGGMGAPPGAPPAAAPPGGQAGGPPGGPPGGGPRERTVFPSDDKIQKVKARFMLRMVDSLNHVVLAALPERSNPPVRIGCTTCHHGLPVPATLESTLSDVVDKFGADSAIKRYKQLRQDMVSGKYDFSETSVNELARKLADRGKVDDAMALLTMNQEFYPSSADIDFQMAELYAKRGDKEHAIQRYQMGLTKRPNDQRARRALQDLGGKPPA